MKNFFSVKGAIIVMAIAVVFLVGTADAFADRASRIEREAISALKELYKTSPKAKELGEEANGILVFPKMMKGGFIFGLQSGQGALIKGGVVDSFYKSTAVSFGLQAGIKQFGYVIFFMSEKSLDYLDRTDGFELGTAPSLVVVDAGIARTLSTTSIQKGIYAFFFSKKGLMAGLGVQGTKVTKLNL